MIMVSKNHSDISLMEYQDSALFTWYFNKIRLMVNHVQSSFLCWMYKE